jgi:hypothetical protein
LIDRILLGETSFDEVAEDDWRIFVQYDFANESKIAAARKLTNDADPSRCLAAFKPLVASVLQFLDLMEVSAESGNSGD